MSPPNRLALEAIVGEMRILPGRDDSLAERLESAGRLLIQAIEVGAFTAPQFTGFKTMVRQRLEQPKVNGFISAWSEALWWLNGRSKETQDLAHDLAGDVEFVIARMLKGPKSRKRVGRPRDTDPKQDRRISETWNASGCRSFAEFAGTDAGRRFDLTARKLQAAHERHRKRQSRKPGK